jgi:hypothetical protein
LTFTTTAESRRCGIRRYIPNPLPTATGATTAERAAASTAESPSTASETSATESAPTPSTAAHGAGDERRNPPAAAAASTASGTAAAFNHRVQEKNEDAKE